MSWGIDIWVSSPKAGCARPAASGCAYTRVPDLVANGGRRAACVSLPEKACKRSEKGSKGVAARERVAGSARGRVYLLCSVVFSTL